MSALELQVLETESTFDETIRRIEQGDPDILDSVVAGGRFHEMIENLVTQAIDEV